MGHCIQAIIGRYESVQNIADNWNDAQAIELPQGFGMVFLTNALLEDITELFDVPDEDFGDPVLDYFTVAADQILQEYSFRTKLAYVETDYFGGTGVQAGVLYENGHISMEPRRGEGTINFLLKELGARCVPGKDAFDSLELWKYRHMPDPD